MGKLVARMLICQSTVRFFAFWLLSVALAGSSDHHILMKNLSLWEYNRAAEEITTQSVLMTGKIKQLSLHKLWLDSGRYQKPYTDCSSFSHGAKRRKSNRFPSIHANLLICLTGCKYCLSENFPPTNFIKCWLKKCTFVELGGGARVNHS